jgi:ribosomal protein S18 acetylase RimI-like enzyme
VYRRAFAGRTPNVTRGQLGAYASAMATIVQASVVDWERVREIRLRGLADAPSAFGSTFEEERAEPESFWRERLGRANAATFLALDELRAVGLVTVFFEDVGRAHLVSMWVSPEARREGIGRALVQTVLEWAARNGAETVELWVTEANEPACHLYERCGFTSTGGRQPLPSDPTLDELEMRRGVTPP